MSPRKRSFFERLTGTIHLDDDYDEYDDEEYQQPQLQQQQQGMYRDSLIPDREEEGELPVDMYQTSDEIVVQAMVAGVRPEDLDISISREMVIIKGRREGPRGIEPQNYYHNELYWGPFSRTLILPQEVEVEEAEAIESHGLLILHLPKLDKAKETKLRVKSRT